MEKRLVGLLRAGLFVLALGGITWAQAAPNVAGTWIMTNQGQKGVVVNVLMLDQDGIHVTGTLRPEKAAAIPIDNGVVNGKTVTFSVTRQDQDKQVKVEYKGTVSGDNMEGTFQQGRSSVKWSAKRQVYEGG